MAFGAQGGDMQDQITLQYFLNIVHFGMNVQQALEAPAVYSEHFPSSFYPRPAYPARVAVERGVSPAVIEELQRRGHEARLVESQQIGKEMGLCYDAEHGVIASGVTPKSDGLAYALGW